MSFSDIVGKLTPGDPAPLYIQLQTILREAITRRVLPPNSAILPERELAEEYKVSRITVRKALEGLAEEGLLTRRRGAGSFVAGARV
jgi:GntR family transcriptional regulator